LPSPESAEVVTVSLVVGDVLTVVRGVESSTPRSVRLGDQLVQGITAAAWDALVAGLAGKADSSALSAYLTTAAATGTYVPIARALQARLPDRVTVNQDLAPSPPTITESATATLVTSIYTVGCQDFAEFSPLGCLTTVNTTFGFIQGNTTGKSNDDTHIGFTVHGDSVEVSLRSFTPAFGQRYWIWVNGRPVTTSCVTPGVSVGAGSGLWLKLVFGAVGSYDVKIYTSGCQFISLAIPVAQGVSPSQQKPWLIGFVGDSWGSSNVATGFTALDAFPRWAGAALGAEIVQGCTPGSGYVQPGSTTQPYGDSQRVATMVALKPDLLVITAGGNDFVNPPATVTAAATALYATYRAALPKTPIIVVGQFPNSLANATTQSFIDNAKAIRDAAVSAVAAGTVLGYIDPLGIADTGVIPAAYANGVSYAVGDRRLSVGGYYECTEAHTGGATLSPRRWKQLSWLTGTGRAGATTGDGNRDSFLGSDLGHPNGVAGCQWLGQRIAAGVVDILKARATG
jgi:hypothetical protein